MADSTPKGESPKNSQPEASEDAETRAARRELKQSSISEADARPATPPTGTDATTKEPAENDAILSPKKKRAHDQLDADKKADEAEDAASVSSGKDREKGEEPEKKRVRDEDKSTAEAETKGTESKDKNQQQTSSSAFAASGFGKLASGGSGFGALGGSGGSAFGSAASGSKLSSFASPSKQTDATSKEAPKLSFGGSNTASPFAKIGNSSNGFGGALGGGGFGGVGGGARLGSFAAPAAKPLGSSKPAKPFGAPDSDAESDGDDDDEDQDEKDDKDDDGEERAVSPVKDSEDKKKSKLHKVEVDTGEAGEATIVSVRAKVFHLDNTGKDAGVEPAWKERGSGMLKINVPRACVDFDEDTGLPIPGSFDASGLEVDDEEVGEEAKGHKVVRLILRQDHTHRVILNTAINASTKFLEKQTLKSAVVQFMAFEGGVTTPVNFTLRMTSANCKAFMDEMNVVLRSLQDS